MLLHGAPGVGKTTTAGKLKPATCFSHHAKLLRRGYRGKVQQASLPTDLWCVLISLVLHTRGILVLKAGQAT
jgi:hypothetical protein